MRKALLATCTFVALAAGAAHATGINLFWNDCSPAAGGVGTSNRDNACTSNSGPMLLIGSLNPMPGIEHCIGEEALIYIRTSAPTLSPWWQMRSDGCRPTSGTAQFAFGALQSCADPWSGQAMGHLDYSYVGGFPNDANVTVVCAQSAATAGPMEPDVEWYIFQVAINQQKTVGPGSCAGCLDGACIVLGYIRILQPGRSEWEHHYSWPDQSQIVTYRGGGRCVVTATRNRTWGGIKAIYR